MLKLIVAVDRNNGIGINNKLPWTNKEDLKEFKRITLGHGIIMGRKTLESIGKALPGRTNYVVTHKNELPYENVILIHDVNAFFESKRASKDVVFVIGGASLYEIALDYVDEMIISEVFGDYSCDTFFPKFNQDSFKLSTEVAYDGFIQKRYVRI
ncbi:MAG: dihydrofolate reductase [Erysipelotrichaceae bacterium]|nr:MAG: dihydrofolate [Erysipelotrichaceae bacterium]TXT17365.1 MAG: dihydrofolate reductase [Erysipelotrichaceae bacterium]